MKKRTLISLIYTVLFGIYVYVRWDTFKWEALTEMNAYIILVFALWPMHIILEGIKWQKLLSVRIPLWKSCTQVLSGYSTALWTPGQWGHFIGRKWQDDAESWGSVTGKTLLSGFWQSWAYIALGGISLWWLDAPEEAKSLWLLFQYGSLALVIAGWGAVFIFAERLHHIPTDLFRNKIWVYFVQTIQAIAQSDQRLHLQLMILSVVKAFVVCVQLGLLLNNSPEQWWGIPIIFMALTLFPLPFMLGMIARGELILQIWHWLDWPSEEAYASIYVLWLINVLFSAIVGTAILLVTPKMKRNE